MTTESEIERNLHRIRDRMERACVRSGRSAAEVTLIAVSKTVSASVISEAVRAGVTDLGENRVQELREKVEQVQASPRWHMIGHLQSNKVKDAVRFADVIQSVHSPALALKLGLEASTIGKILDVLIEVNIGQEPQKSGVSPASLDDVVSSIAGQQALRLRGLMAIPPVTSPEQIRRYFQQMRDLRDRLKLTRPDCTELSMGMSEDFEIAIQEGATMVRIGRAIFGERQQ